MKFKNLFEGDVVAFKKRNVVPATNSPPKFHQIHGADPISQVETNHPAAGTELRRISDNAKNSAYRTHVHHITMSGAPFGYIMQIKHRVGNNDYDTSHVVDLNGKHVSHSRETVS